MNFQDYLIQEINEQDLDEVLDFDDTSIVYSYDIDYTTQEQFTILFTLSFEFNLIMTTSVMISMLRQAQNGEQMLTILDSLVNDTVENEMNIQPTLEEIEF